MCNVENYFKVGGCCFFGFGFSIVVGEIDCWWWCIVFDIG